MAGYWAADDVAAGYWTPSVVYHKPGSPCDGQVVWPSPGFMPPGRMQVDPSTIPAPRGDAPAPDASEPEWPDTSASAGATTRPMNFYYKGNAAGDCDDKPLESGRGGNFDGGGASARLSGVTDLLGVALVVAMLLRWMRVPR